MPLIYEDFPIYEISKSSQREKSIRHGHISTLQQWWARRPLGVCRSAIFAALCPSVSEFNNDHELLTLLNNFDKTKVDTRTKLIRLTSDLAKWESAEDNELLNIANRIIMYKRDTSPFVVDSFAGGGSFPIEALRLGLSSYAGELNPVATTALRLAIEYLPKFNEQIIDEYVEIAEKISQQLDNDLHCYYGNKKEYLAFMWARTYVCPKCTFTVPLLNNLWLARGKREIFVRLTPNKNKKNFNFTIVGDGPGCSSLKPSSGTIVRKKATCPHCHHDVSTEWLQNEGINGRLGDLLYAKLVLTENGDRIYELATNEDKYLVNNLDLDYSNNLHYKSFPNESFDINGVRHTWMMRYGISSTGDLYLNRQKITMLHTLDILEEEKQLLIRKYGKSDKTIALILLLMQTFNRIVSYGTKHAWWQSNGEFPASMFTKQAIPMIWNYVEVPITSVGAAGWLSAINWISLTGKHLTNLPDNGEVWQGDAANLPIADEVVDLFAIDPPYYDSVAYSYLSDTYYIWMKLFLSDLFPSEFSHAMSPKQDEAIVDRKHKLATNPKTDSHYREKMSKALLRARKILKPNGKIILMFGHKKVEAWHAFLDSVIQAGFKPIVSWPIHTERKQKFQHGRIDSLSSSCLIVCEPINSENYTEMISWEKFKGILRKHILKNIQKYEDAYLTGSDLFASLIATSYFLFSSYKVTLNNEVMTGKEFLNQLPEITQECHFKMIIDGRLKKYPEIIDYLERLQIEDNELNWDRKESNISIINHAKRFSILLKDGKIKEADHFFGELSKNEKLAITEVLKGISLICKENSSGQKTANASLGRITRINYQY